MFKSIAIGIGILAIPALCFAQETNQYNYSEHKQVHSYSEQDHAHSDALHHYRTPADEADDAYLITKVKIALRDNGVVGDHAVLVDCDHGICSLTGVVDSKEDALDAVDIASNVEGVIAVRNNLEW